MKLLKRETQRKMSNFVYLFKRFTKQYRESLVGSGIVSSAPFVHMLYFLINLYYHRLLMLSYLFHLRFVMNPTAPFHKGDAIKIQTTLCSA